MVINNVIERIRVSRLPTSFTTMLKTDFLQHGLRAFARLKSWDLNSIKLLERYLLALQLVSSYDKLLHSMILVSEFYDPIHITYKKGLYSPSLKNYVALENAHRTLKRAEAKLYKRKLLDAIDEKGQKRIVVTSRGEKIFYRSYPLAKLRDQKWGGFWTIVMYDFPEEKRQHRDRLREKLEKHGFGSPQLSVYISPLPLQKPIQQLIEGESYEDYAWVTRAQTVFGKTSREIVAGAWPVGVLNQLYERLVQTYNLMPISDDLDLFWQTAYLAVNNQDPYLPYELLPKPWHGKTCQKLYAKATRPGFLSAII